MASAVMNLTAMAHLMLRCQGHPVVEVLLCAVILFQLTRKIYKALEKPRPEKICYYFGNCKLIELMKWMNFVRNQSQSLHPPITEEMLPQHATLESDEGVHWGVQNGLDLSGSTLVYFKHNDMSSLESTLDKMTHG